MWIKWSFESIDIDQTGEIDYEELLEQVKAPAPKQTKK